jgi:hypothetical protein
MRGGEIGHCAPAGWILQQAPRSRLSSTSSRLVNDSMLSYSPLVVYQRDYKAEAAKLIDELPEDTKQRKDYKYYKDWRQVYFG